MIKNKNKLTRETLNIPTKSEIISKLKKLIDMKLFAYTKFLDKVESYTDNTSIFDDKNLDKVLIREKEVKHGMLDSMENELNEIKEIEDEIYSESSEFTFNHQIKL